MKIKHSAEYREKSVELVVETDKLHAAGITYEALVLAVLKYYGPRQYASKVEAATKKGKEVPAFSDDDFVKWLLAERASGEPTKADKAEAERIAKRFTELMSELPKGATPEEREARERQIFAAFERAYSAAKSGFKFETSYDVEVAYNDADAWVAEARRFRLFTTKVEL